MEMESGKLGLISCTTNPVLEEGDNSTTSEITIKIKHEGQGTTSSSQGHEEIHTMLQSPGGSSHFIKGLVVANAASETISSSQLQTTIMDHDEIYLPDRDGTTLVESLAGADATGHILQMVRLATDENGETIIFVQPQDKNDCNSAPVVVLNSEGHPSIDALQSPLTLNTFHDHSSSPTSEDIPDFSNGKIMGGEDEDMTALTRRCVVCLRRRKFTEEIFDDDNNPYYHIRVIFAHLNMQVEGTPTDSGVCLECLHYLQQWHIFHSTIAERHDYARNTGTSVVPGPLNFHSLEAQIYKQYTKLLEAKEIFHAATHAHYVRRHLTDKDWDFFSDQLTLALTDTTKFDELKDFIMGGEKLSKFLCTICSVLIPDGTSGYIEHMKKEHGQCPVLFPCDMCGKIFPGKSPDTNACMVDYFDHWVSHFHLKIWDRIPVVEDCTNPVVENDGVTLSQENSDIIDEESTQKEKEQTYSNKRRKMGSEVKRQKYQHKINQIKNVLNNSSYQHLIRRDLDEESFEFIAERLLTTKSNSSAKMKEIENMTFSKERMRNIFCEDCRKTISGGKDGYHEHRKTIHNDTDEYLTIPCDICGNFYPEKDLTGLSEHYFTHWIFHFYFEECRTCQEKCPNVNLLKKHNLLHEKRTGYPCPQCDKVLAKKITLEHHIKTHLSEEEKMKNALTCHICGKTITAPTLKAHMFSVHSDERPWKCEVCGARFKHKSDLNGHRNAVHLKIKNFTCNICGKSFGHQCGLRVHIMSHEDKRNYSCPTCNKRFLTMWHLKKHIVTHKEDKDILCPTCGKGFKKQESLQEHMTIHTGEMPHECHICGRKVRVLSNLYKHFLVHKKNKTYYSKKDGLPDPLDAYIVEQQKKKSVNKILLAAESRSFAKNDNNIDSSSSDYILEDGMENDPDIDNIIGLGDADLQVNRSVNNKVVTYRRKSNRINSTANTTIPSTENSQNASFSSPTLQQNSLIEIVSDESQQGFYVSSESEEALSLNHHVESGESMKNESGRPTEEYHLMQQNNVTSWPKLSPVVMMDIGQPNSSSRPIS